MKLGISERKIPISLVIRDAVHQSRLRFPGWQEAHEHIRTVVLGQIVEQLAELALQEDPSEWTEEIEQLRALAKDINYPRDEQQLRYAVEQWAEYADESPSFTIVEIL